jgi:hypothetical protein
MRKIDHGFYVKAGDAEGRDNGIDVATKKCGKKGVFDVINYSPEEKTYSDIFPKYELYVSCNGDVTDGSQAGNQPIPPRWEPREDYLIRKVGQGFSVGASDERGRDQGKDAATEKCGGKNEAKTVIDFSSTEKAYSYYNPKYQQYILCRGDVTNQKSKI